MADFTPGTWQVQDNSGYERGQIRVDSETHGAVADCGVNEGQADYVLAHMRANARLIAAAPDLLSALERVTNELENGGASMIAIRAMIEDARAAIAKARGEG